MIINILPESNIIFFQKFGANRWMKKLQDGDLSFAALGYYIYTAKVTGNKDQGDEDEGVFARLKNNDPRINQASSYLNNDLEVIKDVEDYVKLRRPSSRYIPTFCIYGLSVGDLASSPHITSPGIQTIPHYYDERMYSGFADSYSICNVMNEDYVPTQFLVKTDIFKYLLLGSLEKNGIGYKSGKINYTEYAKDEFYLDPVGDKREELLHKFPYYSYQLETRVCLPDNRLLTIFDRFPLNIGKIPESHLIAGRKISAAIKADIVEVGT